MILFDRSPSANVARAPFNGRRIGLCAKYPIEVKRHAGIARLCHLRKLRSGIEGAAMGVSGSSQGFKLPVWRRISKRHGPNVSRFNERSGSVDGASKVVMLLTLRRLCCLKYAKNGKLSPKTNQFQHDSRILGLPIRFCFDCANHPLHIWVEQPKDV
jgi:hypothetical protein